VASSFKDGGKGVERKSIAEKYPQKAHGTPLETHQTISLCVRRRKADPFRFILI